MESQGAARSGPSKDDAALEESQITERELARAREAYVLRLARFGLLQPALRDAVQPAPTNLPQAETDSAGGR